MSEKEEIASIYQKFCSAEGNQHIASEYAVRKIQQLVTTFRIKYVLEVGLGIGSIAGTLLAINKNLSYTGTEANNFCLKALPRNLGPEYQRLEVLENLKSVSREKKFDLVIIDGKDTGLRMLEGLMAEEGIITIEGDRMPQQELLQELFPRHKFVHSISRDKNQAFSPFPPKHWQGGIKIIFVNPRRKQKIWWLKEKALTKMKYFYRNSR